MVTRLGYMIGIGTEFKILKTLPRSVATNLCCRLLLQHHYYRLLIARCESPVGLQRALLAETRIEVSKLFLVTGI